MSYLPIREINVYVEYYTCFYINVFMLGITMKLDTSNINIHLPPHEKNIIKKGKKKEIKKGNTSKYGGLCQNPYIKNLRKVIPR